MARIDVFVAQLFTRDGDALMLEGGNNIFLLKGTAAEPLVAARAGQMQNEHIAMLLKDIAPEKQHGQIDRGEACEFIYDQNEHGAVRIKFGVVQGKYVARVKRHAPRAAAESTPPATEAARTVSGEMPAVLSASSAISLLKPMSDEQPATTSDGRPRIEAWFDIFLKLKASDLHLTTGRPASVRVDGDVRPLAEIPVLSAGELERVLKEIMPERSRAEWDETHDTDFAYEVPGARLRANVFLERNGPAAVFRRIPARVQSAAELGIPAPIIELCKLKKGLILVTGPTGSGKSTTLAAMVDWINANRADHIITIEDPIEFVHEPKKCIIHQRQVGHHTQSFTRALRAALREDPDIILVGEMRDLETVAIAIEMAETGHLVLGTLHTTTAAGTVDRIVDQFSGDQQEQIRQMLAESLRGVISQTLCKKKGGGRVFALEVLLCTNAISNLIREKKTFQIASTMQTMRGQGMRTLNDSLLELVKKDQITAEEALDKAIDKHAILKELKNQGFLLNAEAPH